MLLGLITKPTPLLDLPGIGPVSAAIALTSRSHPGRVRDNRTGDRQLNQVLHTIANSRTRHADRTREHTARRTEQGLSKHRIRRCLK